MADSGRSPRGRQTGQDALVNRFFPQWLVDESNDDFNAGGPPPYRATAYVKALDVDHDGRPEVVVSFSSAKGLNADWVLRWQDGTLKSIGPEEVDPDGDASTLLSDAMFIDLDGDGVMEIVNGPDDVDPNAGPQPVQYDVYALSGGRYALSKTLAFVGTFARPLKRAASSTGRQDRNSLPEVVTQTFLVADPSTATYEMTVVNGDETGAHRVTSADVFVNGAAVAGPGSFRGDRRIVTVRLKRLTASNTIRAVLRGARDTWLTITLSPASIGAR